MFDYFYHFHCNPLGNDLFNSSDEAGHPPSPPGQSLLVNSQGVRLINSQKYALVGNQ